jgi:hypothetical protein
MFIVRVSVKNKHTQTGIWSSRPDVRLGWCQLLCHEATLRLHSVQDTAAESCIHHHAFEQMLERFLCGAMAE